MRIEARAAAFAVLLSGALAASTPAGAGDVELLSPQSAAKVAAEALPSAVASSESQGSVGSDSPSVVERQDGFVSTGTEVTSRLPQQPEDAITLRTQSGLLSLTPLDVNPAATDGDAVNGDSVVWANTAKDTDTIVRPTPSGIESYTSIRDDTSPETTSWRVGLTGDETLRKNEDGTISVLDTDPDVDTSSLPANRPARKDELEGAKAIGQIDETVTMPDPDAAAAADAAVGRAGVKRSEEPPVGEGPQPPSAPQPEAPRERPSSEHLADTAAEVDQKAEDEALAGLEASRQEAATTDRQAAAANEAEDRAILDAPTEVARIGAPVALDAEGRTVPIELDASGDTLTMTVDHHDAGVTYPVVADPYVLVTHHRIITRYRPIYRTESYIARWEDRSASVGNWHPVYCQWGFACASAGWGWFNVSAYGNRYVAYWPGWNWGPAWLVYSVPVWSQRTVLDHWEPYYDIEDYESWEWADDDPDFEDVTDETDSTTDGTLSVRESAASGTTASAAQIRALDCSITKVEKPRITGTFPRWGMSSSADARCLTPNPLHFIDAVLKVRACIQRYEYVIRNDRFVGGWRDFPNARAGCDVRANQQGRVDRLIFDGIQPNPRFDLCGKVKAHFRTVARGYLKPHVTSKEKKGPLHKNKPENPYFDCTNPNPGG